MAISEIAARINWVDVLIVILLFRIGYVGFDRGLSGEVWPLAGIFTALILSLHFYIPLGESIAAFTPLATKYGNAVAFIAINIITIYCTILLDMYVISRMVTIKGVSIYNRIGGVVLGILRGVLIISIILIALDIVPLEYMDYSIKERSLTGKVFLKTGHTVYDRTCGLLRIKKNG